MHVSLHASHVSIIKLRFRWSSPMSQFSRTRSPRQEELLQKKEVKDFNFRPSFLSIIQQMTDPALNPRKARVRDEVAKFKRRIGSKTDGHQWIRFAAALLPHIRPFLTAGDESLDTRVFHNQQQPSAGITGIIDKFTTGVEVHRDQNRQLSTFPHLNLC